MGYLGPFTSGEFSWHFSLELQPEVASAQEKACRSTYAHLPQKHAPPGRGERPGWGGRSRREELIPKSNGSLKTREKEKLMISVSGDDLCLPRTQSTPGPWVWVRIPPAER